MNFENIKDKEKREDFKPEIRIGTYDDVRTSIYFEALESLVNDDWEYKQNQEIAEKVKNTLEEENFGDFLHKYKSFQEKVANKELLSWLALAYGRDNEFKDYIIQDIVQYKGFEGEEAREIMKEFDEIMAKFINLVNLDQVIKPFVANNIEERNEQLPELKEYLDNALKFFKVKEGDIEIKEYIYLPTNPLYKKQSGNGMEVGENWFINAEIDNRVNQVHEFLHSVINPIVFDKYQDYFTEEEWTQIGNMASGREKRHYNSGVMLLVESLLHTYRTGLVEENKSLSYEEFKNNILNNTSKEKITSFLNFERRNGRNWANSAGELLNNEELLRNLYEKELKDELSEKVYDFYQNYAAQDELTFAEYFQKNYKDLLK